MSEICCDLCKFWLSELKECGNTHIDKCVSKEYFARTERNCGTCEREIYNEALGDVDNIITEQLDKSDNQVECQTLRWMLDVLSDLVKW